MELPWSKYMERMWLKGIDTILAGTVSVTRLVWMVRESERAGARAHVHSTSIELTYTCELDAGKVLGRKNVKIRVCVS
jgi:hypothetical protein